MLSVEMQSIEKLPTGYGDLSPLLEWALETENERHAKRLASSIAQTRILYDAMAPRMDAIIQRLQQIPTHQALPAADHALFLLALSFIEVSIPIELNWQQTHNAGSYPTTRLERPHRA